MQGAVIGPACSPVLIWRHRRTNQTESVLLSNQTIAIVCNTFLRERETRLKGQSTCSIIRPIKSPENRLSRSPGLPLAFHLSLTPSQDWFLPCTDSSLVLHPFFANSAGLSSHQSFPNQFQILSFSSPACFPSPSSRLSSSSPSPPRSTSTRNGFVCSLPHCSVWPAHYKISSHC